MTLWRDSHWDIKYKERLGYDVYKFIEKDPLLITYLSDFDYVTNKIKSRATEYQLDDNSMFVLHMCKFFEGVLSLIANETGWFMKFNTGTGTSIRGFFLNYRTNIEAELKQRCPQEHRNITDRLFSTVQDFNERNKAVHYGSLIQVGEIDNYEAILTKVRDIVKILLENKIIV